MTNPLKPSNAQLLVNGKAYGGFKSISIKQSVEAISSVFSFDFSDMWTGTEEPWPLNCQDLVQIELYGKIVLRGYIDVLRGDLGSDTISYTIEGRDKTSDLIDCSVEEKTYTSIALLPLVQDLCKEFPVSFAVSGGVSGREMVKNIRADFGETVFEVLDRIAGKTGVLFVPDGKGDLVITTRGDSKAAVKLIEGSNAKSFSFSKDYSQRFSEYIIQGSTSKANSETAPSGWFDGKPGSKAATKSSPRADVQDRGVTRRRPLRIKQTGNADGGTTKKKAIWEANVRAAKSLEITCNVQGWTQDGQRLWRINEMVNVIAPRLGIGNAFGDEYLIAEVEYALSPDGGETTYLKLLPKEAFIPEDQVDKKKRDTKGKSWF